MGGAPKGNQNARKNKQNNQKQPKACYSQQNKQNNQKQHDLDLDHDLDLVSEFESEFEKEREEPPPPEFSKHDELKPHQKDIAARVEGCRRFWAECGLPPAQIITNIQKLNDLQDALSTFSDEKITEAVKNYAALISRPGFDESVLPGGRKPADFKNFLQRWVEKFVDEAKPFERFMSKAERSEQAGKDYFDRIFSEIEERQKHG
jgi:hypothetical protein